MRTLLEAAAPMTNQLSQEELIHLMSEHAFFKGMSQDHLKTLAEYAMITEYAVGQLILREGDLANRFYVILEGTVSLETYVKNHGISCIQSITSGDVLGWSWLVPPHVWKFDARVVSRTRAIFFYGTVLREKCETDPALGYELMKRTAEVVVNRLQSTRKRLIAALAENQKYSV